MTTPPPAGVGQQIIAEATLLADAIRTAPHAKVRKYPAWDLASLGRHVGEIHAWATGIVRDGATERPVRAKLDNVPDNDVPGVVHVGAVALAETLDVCDLAGPVWSFSENWTNGFWCRRMLMETTIHRWDAQDAIGTVTPIAHEIALLGIQECLELYLAGSMPDGGSLTLDGRSLVVMQEDASVTIKGGAVDLWLFTMGRGSLRAFEVDGHQSLATQFADFVKNVSGPA